MAYGYVRDKEPLGINWAEISKNFNDRLAADEAERQGKRDDIQKQYDELSQELIDKPTGADIDLNSAISSFSTQASQASLENLNKLKRGEISEREYYNRRANLKSSTSNLFLYANNFNNQLQENLSLIQSQDPDKQGSGGMAFQMALAQNMLNFKNTVAIIDPATDEVMLVKTDEEGNPTNEVVSVSQLGNLSTQKEMSYNYRKQIANRLDGKGTQKYRDKDGREVITILGAEIDSQTAKDTIDAIANSLLGDEAQQRSILYQNGYQYTQDESLKGKDGYIYYDIKNGTYDFDPAKAKEILVKDITSSIPETVLEVKEKTPVELRREELEIEALQNQVDLGDIKISDALKKLGKDLSTFNSQLEADIKNSLGEDFNTNYANNRTAFLGFLGRDSQKAENAIDASLATLNEYGAWAGVNVEIKGSNIVFSTPLFDDNGKKLDEPFTIEIPVTNIKSGQQLQNTMQAFISNYSDPIFVDNAYTTGKFTEPKKEEEEPIPDDRTEIVLSFGTISVPNPDDKKQYLSINEFRQDYPKANFNDYLIYSRPDLASNPAQ